jgi:hypothetical protein
VLTSATQEAGPAAAPTGHSSRTTISATAAGTGSSPGLAHAVATVEREGAQCMPLKTGAVAAGCHTEHDGGSAHSPSNSQAGSDDGPAVVSTNKDQQPRKVGLDSVQTMKVACLFLSL